MMGGDGIGVLLLSTVGGYWVLERASSHKGRLRQAGQIIGGVIVAVSLIGVACRVWCLVSSTLSCKTQAAWRCPFVSPNKMRMPMSAPGSPGDGP